MYIIDWSSRHRLLRCIRRRSEWISRMVIKWCRCWLFSRSLNLIMVCKLCHCWLLSRSLNLILVCKLCHCWLLPKSLNLIMVCKWCRCWLFSRSLNLIMVCKWYHCWLLSKSLNLILVWNWCHGWLLLPIWKFRIFHHVIVSFSLGRSWLQSYPREISLLRLLWSLNFDF